MGGLGVKFQHFPLTLLVVLTTLTLPCERDLAVAGIHLPIPNGWRVVYECDDISNGSEIIALTDRQTNTQTDTTENNITRGCMVINPGVLSGLSDKDHC